MYFPYFFGQFRDMPVVHDTSKAWVWTLVSADLLNRNIPHNTFPTFQMPMMQISLSLGSEHHQGDLTARTKGQLGPTGTSTELWISTPRATWPPTGDKTSPNIHIQVGHLASHMTTAGRRGEELQLARVWGESQGQVGTQGLKLTCESLVAAGKCQLSHWLHPLGSPQRPLSLYSVPGCLFSLLWIK